MHYPEITNNVMLYKVTRSNKTNNVHFIELIVAFMLEKCCFYRIFNHAIHCKVKVKGNLCFRIYCRHIVCIIMLVKGTSKPCSFFSSNRPPIVVMLLIFLLLRADIVSISILNSYHEIAN